jgi:hypothetical protein
MAKPPLIRDRVKEAMKEHPKLGYRDLAAKMGLRPEQVRDAQFCIKYPTVKKAASARWRRDQGIRPMADHLARKRAKSIAHAKEALKLRRKGLTAREVGDTLGLTKNAVIGRLWRAKQRLEGRAHG